MRGQAVELEQVAMRFGGVTAVSPTDLTIEAGEFFSILGPSGCGKTTLLRIIAGFQDPSEGSVRIGAKEMRGIGPSRRPTALIFQNLALFPLMSVWENVAFGLEARGVGRSQRRARAEALLGTVALTEHAAKLPGQLSGGQRQRVAIARALAVEPAVLLLDEPLSALDLKLRQHMRAELRAIQERVGITFIYITHDQGEALAMSDRVAVMRQGQVEQIDTPERVYAEPRTPFVAGFVGETNRLRARVTVAADGRLMADTPIGPVHALNPSGLKAGDHALIFIRPERLRLGDESAPNRIEGTLTRRTLEGSVLQLGVEAAGQDLQAQATNGPEARGHAVGDPVTLGFTPEDALALPDA